MFDNYVGAKTAKTGAWTVNLVIAAVVLHVAAGAALIVKSWWTIAEIDRPTRASAGLSSAPPPPPSAQSYRDSSSAWNFWTTTLRLIFSVGVISPSSIEKSLGRT